MRVDGDQPQEHLTSVTLDLLLLGSLSPSDANRAKRHLDGCGTCRERWRELNADKQHFDEHVFARTLSSVEARLAGSQSRFERFKLWLVLPAAGLLASLVVAVLIFAPRSHAEPSPLRKAPSLEVYALRDGAAPFEVRRGAKLLPKDRLGFVVDPGAARFLLIASRDGAGSFTVYYPYASALSAPIDPKTPRPLELPRAVQLDDSLGPEQLVAVFSSEPVTAIEVEQALAHDPAAPRVRDASIVTWDFVKTAP